jgi:general secretion pathway protein A
MYEQFFGLEEEPFRLTPDPRYLYLSTKHAEALAHLKLCLTESSGFVCITGDVGTGKTTLLRLFLSELGPNVSSAYTFVPPLSALELVRRICREFKLQVGNQTQDELVDQLHQFLMAQYREGRMCVLILDEAQALSIELLEQIRLLLNLETNTQKLLRIVLVGQPQLRKLLLDPELAQLNQRITLRWHLGPLSARQTTGYITHRLTVASGGRGTHIFTRPALRLIHHISGGVPRLINMIAHRALLAAFVEREPRITRRTISQAYKEIQSVPLPGTLSMPRRAVLATVGLTVGALLVVMGGPQLDWLRPRLGEAIRSASKLNPGRVSTVVGAPLIAAPAAAAPEQVRVALVEERPQAEPVAAHAAAARETVAEVEPAAPLELARQAPPDATLQAAAALPAQPAQPQGPQVAAQVAPAAEPAQAPPTQTSWQVTTRVGTGLDAPKPMSGIDLSRTLGSSDVQATARTATDGLLAAWGEHPLAADENRLPDEIENVAMRRGLLDVGLTGNRSMLRLLDLPALLTLRLPGSATPRFAALLGMDGTHAVLSIGGATTTVELAALDPIWSGQAHILWRDFDGIGANLSRGARGVVVTRLQQLLQRAGAYHPRPTGVFDAETRTAVVAFQHANHLAEDGIVGPLTRIVLYRTAGGYPRPTLAAAMQGAT